MNLIKRLTLLATVTTLCIAMVGCSSKKDKEIKSHEVKTEVIGEENEKNPIVTMKIKEYGEINIELYPDVAPNTVNNFISLIEDGFYDGLIFHRIIENFMIQGGDPLGNGTGGPGYTIAGEFSSNNFENNLKHTVGVISMARTLEPDTAGSQFFIVTSDSPHLDGEYAAFGKVITGLDIIDEIGKVDTDENDKPIKDVVIESVTIDKKGVEYKEPKKIN